MIYIFRQYDSQARIIIYAESYIEAKETLFEFNPWADRVYNILEYKMYRIDYYKFFDILDIEPDMFGYPRIISEDEFKELEKNNIILDEQFKNANNTKVLTKQLAGENTSLLSTEEFVDQLKNYTDSVKHIKKNIYQMMNITGDIWVKEFKIKYLTKCYHYKVYGRSRYQCEKFLKILIDKLNVICETYHPSKLLIKDFNSINNNDISNYIEMINFMKENNIKKFPFSTYNTYKEGEY